MPKIAERKPEWDALLKKTGSYNPAEASQALTALAAEVNPVIRAGILDGNIYSDIFTPQDFPPGTTLEFPLDMIAPGTESDWAAYTMPQHGRIPERTVESDYVQVQVYNIASSIDWLLKYAREARWDVFKRAMQVYEATYVRKINLDALNLVVGAAVGRNIIAYDAAASVGFLSKRLISLMQTLMFRGGGGNLASDDQITLTDIWMSPEAIETIRGWQLTEVDDVTRQRIFNSADGLGGGLNNIFGVNLHVLSELGVGQRLQNYFTQLGGTMPGSPAKQEIIIGMDMSDGDNFIMPIRQQLQTFEDPALHRQQRAGYYGWMELGYFARDSRKIILGSI